MFGNEDEREDDDGAMKQDMDEAVVTHELGVSLRSEQPPPISKMILSCADMTTIGLLNSGALEESLAK